MPLDLIALVRQSPRWKLWATFAVIAIVCVEVVVSAMSIFFNGTITPDYLVTGLVAAGIVAPATLGMLTVLLAATNRERETTLRAQAKMADENLNMTVEAAQMMFWEYDVVTDNLIYDDARLNWLGVATNETQHTFPGWLALVHPDDQAGFIQQYQSTIQPGGPDLDIEYRMAGKVADSWVWLHTRGRVIRHSAASEPLWAVGGSINISRRKLAEENLKKSETLLRSTLEATDEGILMIAHDGQVLSANKRFLDLWRVPDALVNKDQDGPLLAHVLDQLVEPDVFMRQVQRLYDSDAQARDTLHFKDGRVFARFTQALAVGAERGRIWCFKDITEQSEAARALEVSQHQAQSLASMLRLMCDNVPDMIWAKDLDKRFVFANKAVCDQLLVAVDTQEPIGKDDLFFAQRQRDSHPERADWHTFGELCQDSDVVTLQQGNAAQFDEYGNVRGEFMFLDVHKAPFIDETGAVIGVVGCARNVTHQRQEEEKLRLASLVLETSSEAMMITDEADRIVDVNPAFTRLTGYRLDEVIGKDPALLHSGQQGEDFYQGMWREIEATGRWQGEMWNRRKNGEIFAEWLTINTIFHSDGTVRRRVALFSDITERKKSEELIWSQANFDMLTQLPNRRMFQDRLAQDMKKAHRAGLKLALMFLDLDHFKEVNDTLGHQKGDVLLVEAARRIVSCVRATDTVARLGGDEFTLILNDLEDPSAAERTAENIIEALRQPFQLGPDEVHIAGSIGITLYPDDSTEMNDLLKNADQAMYVAKSSGRNRFSYFTRAMQDTAQHRLALLNDLRNALSGNQLRLYYQPIVALDTGHIGKVEALVRWLHPQRGMISPAEFIPIAEESGLIHQIGDWVFMEAARQVQCWRENFAADFQISVNVSPIQMQSTKHPARWLDHLKALGLSGQNIVIEITEGLLLESTGHVSTQLLAFRDAGIQVAIDDFGTGYSALSYLKKLDIDYIKIDQSFIRNLGTDASDMALSEAIVVMAHKLGLKVIAEGVETHQQRDLLVAMGCDFAQGYLYAKPTGPGELTELLRACMPYSSMHNLHLSRPP